MADWLRYSLADFLPFSRMTYLRLFELYDARFWPAAAIGLVVGLWLLWLLRSPTPGRLRLALGLLAGCWGWIAWAFLWQTYAPLLWAAPYAAAAFAAQGMLLLGVAMAPWGTGPSPRTGRGVRLGYGLLACAVLVAPPLGLWFGRSWSGLELFGNAPDPTTLATLGLLILLRHPLRALLMPIPVAWALFSGLTLLAMDDPSWPLLPGAALVVLIMVLWESRARGVLPEVGARQLPVGATRLGPDHGPQGQPLDQDREHHDDIGHRHQDRPGLPQGSDRAMATEMPPRSPPQVRIVTTPGEKLRNRRMMPMGSADADDACDQHQRDRQQPRDQVVACQ